MPPSGTFWAPWGCALPLVSSDLDPSVTRLRRRTWLVIITDAVGGAGVIVENLNVAISFRAEAVGVTSVEDEVEIL